MSNEHDDIERWSRLTEKQRACLDLLLERKTSKQIARILNISKPTVDQRITSSRIILGVENRNEAAIAYSRLKALYDRITYDPVHLPTRPVFVPSHFPDGDPEPVLTLNDNRSFGFEAEERFREPFQPFKGLGRHDHSTSARIAIMVTMLTALVIILLAGLGIAQALTKLVSS